MPQPPMTDELKEQLLQAKMITLAAQTEAQERKKTQPPEPNGP